MQIDLKNIADTKVQLTIKAEPDELEAAKLAMITKLAPQVKLAGFRQGNVPPALAEKHIDPNELQKESLEEALNKLYVQGITQNKLRPVADPKIEISKFVPYSTLEFTAEVEVIGEIKLPNYKNIKVKEPEVKVTADDVKSVLKRLQIQSATYKEVTRAAITGDRVWIDFDGTDDKKQPVNGASGKDYPLSLGSNTFIPGFEDNIIGLKKGDDKSFTVSFPKDYHLKALQSKEVTFKIKVNKVEETKLDAIDDAFAAKLGPFKTLDDLKKDIRKQVTNEKSNQVQRDFEDKIIKTIVAKSTVSLPESLLTEQMAALERDFKQNLGYRGETFEDYLKNNGLSEEQYREKELKPAAETRLKAGLVLSEIAGAEAINVTPEEVDIRLQVLKNQYTKDPAMQTELNKPEARRDIASRLLTEKTIVKLVGFAKNIN